ncbi:MAG TPA: AraC family transcriptional regulator [Bradyrhizobium sp.]|jgi:AraC-like DNA-binding protein
MLEIHGLTTFSHKFERPSFVPQKATPEDDRHIAIDAIWVEGTGSHGVADDSDDRVMRSLSSALELAEEERDRHCADALRLAMAIRLAGLGSHAVVAGKQDELKLKARRARALQAWRLKRVIEYIDNHPSGNIGLSDLASIAGLSRMHFASQFRAATGFRPHEFLLRRRVRRSKELLRNQPMAIAEIALTVGFQTQAHFATVFKKIVGCTPRQWRLIIQMPIIPQTGVLTPAALATAGLSGQDGRSVQPR